MKRELKRRRFTVSSLIGPAYIFLSFCLCFGRGQYEETGATAHIHDSGLDPAVVLVSLWRLDDHCVEAR
jgi:hypothetical protein